jgi:hypothetical protein
MNADDRCNKKFLISKDREIQLIAWETVFPYFLFLIFRIFFDINLELL